MIKKYKAKTGEKRKIKLWKAIPWDILFMSTVCVCGFNHSLFTYRTSELKIIMLRKNMINNTTENRRNYKKCGKFAKRLCRNKKRESISSIKCNI